MKKPRHRVCPICAGPVRRSRAAHPACVQAEMRVCLGPYMEPTLQDRAAREFLSSVGISSTTLGGAERNVTHWFRCTPRGAPDHARPEDRPCVRCQSWPEPGELWVDYDDAAHITYVCSERHVRPVVIDEPASPDPSAFFSEGALGILCAAVARRVVHAPDSWQSMSTEVMPPFLGAYALIDQTGPVWCLYWSESQWRCVPQDMLFAAVTDRLLPAAYRGECPGVDPDALLKWRAQRRAKFLRCAVAEVLRDIDDAIAAINTAPRITSARGTVADVRGKYLPELPEATAIFGVEAICDADPSHDMGGAYRSAGTT